MPRNLPKPKIAVPAGKSKEDAPRTMNIPGVGKARTMELRESDIKAMRKLDKEFRKHPKKALEKAKPYRAPKRQLVPTEKALKRITTPSKGGMRFNPKAKLDPSQVEDYRRSPERKRFDDMKNKWPFLTMEQRMKWMADYTRITGKKPPKGMASSIPTWMRQPKPKKRKFPSSRGR